MQQGALNKGPSVLPWPEKKNENIEQVFPQQTIPGDKDYINTDSDWEQH